MKMGTLVYRLTLLALVFAISGCGVFGNSTPQALPTVVLNTGATPASTGQVSTLPGSGGVAASGTVVPAQQVSLAFPLSGIVEIVDVAPGDQVTAGKMLVKLAGSERLAAAVEAANLELLLAQQETLNAQQARQELDRNLPQAQTDALQSLNLARQELKDAERKAAGLSLGASQADLQEAQATLILATDKLDKARKDYKEFENAKENNVYRAAALNRLAQAQREYDNALRRYNNLQGGSTDFYQSQTLAELEIAKARLSQAQLDYDTLLNGPREEDIALADKRIQTAQGRIVAAEAAIKSAQAALADLELKAPFDGALGEVNIYRGEWVIPGQPLLTLADLQNLRIETTDLSERDVPKIEIGQPVVVFIEALNQNVPGRVSAIAPLAGTLGGDVVYKTTIELDEVPPGLRAGMSAEVRFDTE